MSLAGLFRPRPPGGAAPMVLLVGSPNVGKSLLFNRLTGSYVTVSNYPGTTVDVSRGQLAEAGARYEVVDTPGLYALAPITEEERVTCALLQGTRPHAVLHVVDAKNIQRMLGLTLLLADAGLPLILVLNMADEARALGIRFDTARLEQMLGIPVVETAATTGQGVRELVRRIGHAVPAQGIRVRFESHLETTLTGLAESLEDQAPLSRRIQALLLLQTSPATQTASLAAGVRDHFPHSIHYHATLSVQRVADRMVGETVVFPSRAAPGFRERFSRRLMRPLTGIPILLLVLYFGLYKFVGSFGAGTLVDFLQDGVFQKHITPWLDWFTRALVPWPVWQDLFIGPYGIFTLGFRYAVAIIFPIVGTFFLAFSLLEDSGYLPRLAMLLDRLFKKIGLNGRAVIPMVLGLGCGTMATLVTRTLETRREKLIATLLLALAIPCSAQMGVILGLLGGRPGALLLWGGVMLLAFAVTGGLAARFMPGERPRFYMELPPLRWPRPGNVVAKTYARMVWYFKEVLPLFILASGLIWAGQQTGLFQLAIRGLTPVVRAMGLPDAAAVAFLFGFFRRDYGAAGLFDLQRSGALNGHQLVVAAIALSLFVPCVAQVLIMGKERGFKVTLAAVIGITVLAVGMGALVNVLLNLSGVRL